MHDLKSRLNAATHIYNPSKPPFKCASLLFVAAVRHNKHVCSALTLIATLIWEAFLFHKTAEPRIRLKEPAIAGYAYNPSKPPFEKGGIFVSLRLTSPEVSVAILHFGKS